MTIPLGEVQTIRHLDLGRLKTGSGSFAPRPGCDVIPNNYPVSTRSKGR